MFSCDECGKDTVHGAYRFVRAREFDFDEAADDSSKLVCVDCYERQYQMLEKNE